MSPLARTVEALLFLSPEPVSQADLAEAAGCAVEEIDTALAELAAAFAPGERGLLLRELAGGWTLVTAPETEEAARQLLAKPRTPPLTPAQAETLAIVAYRQPVTRAAIERIRGVDSDYTVRSLLHRRLIVELGRSDAPGRPYLYGTGFDFLERFGLASLEELPPLDVDVAARLAEEGGEALTEPLLVTLVLP